ncbi:MAG TPA: biopolymer transporter ExbD [Porticoccaceae bacterium]|nr:biopolymer transporter ExbD [Porticoccaceae bacterium]HCO60003.1 biopolymer transporter ExbD [Porticoccaceae bacterium]
MRRINSKQEEQAQAIDLTPMLDVVFIMLIFFIVTASFIKSPGVEVEKTVTLTALKKKPGILVGINAQNQIWMDKNLVKDSLVKLQLLRLYTENPKGGLVIQVDEEAAVEKIALVADLAKEIGITDISVSTLNE